jgi:NADPH:quinone reductase-like Zn-dependent oxidoreductase
MTQPNRTIAKNLAPTTQPGARPIPGVMRAVFLKGHGGLDQLEFREDAPVPPLAPGEVLVRVGACAVNNTDINTRVGWYGASTNAPVTEEVALHGIPRRVGESASWNRQDIEFPLIQGAAVAGEIVRVAATVSEERLGARVVVDPVIRDMSLRRWARGVQYLGSERNGGFADYVAVPAQNALDAPSSSSLTELACLPCAFQTAEEMQLRASVTQDDRVEVTGASGGVGLANVLLAKLRGARVVAIVAAAKADALRRYGADDVVIRDRESFAAELAQKVGARGADVVLDVVGGTLTRSLWQLLDRAGRFATSGAIGGPVVSVDLRDLIYKDVEMFGVTFPEAEALDNLLRYVSAGQLQPVVDHVFPLSKIADAQALFAAKKHVGKIVIDMRAEE